MEALELTANGFVFTATAAGPADGSLVLLLHGFPQSGHEWHHQLESLARAGYRAVAPDQRGYTPGARPDGVEPYGIGHLVADAMAMADQLGHPRFHLVGHDWGGMVAWTAAANFPERVRTLTVVSTPHPQAFANAYRSPTSGQRQQSSYIELFRSGAGEAALLGADGQGIERFFLGAGLNAEDAAVYQRIHGAPGALERAMNWYRAQAPTDMPGVGPVTVPTLFVWGDQDIYVSRAAAEDCEHYVTGAYHFVPLAGVSHWIPDLAPSVLDDLLLPHLSGAGDLHP